MLRLIVLSCAAVLGLGSVSAFAQGDRLDADANKPSVAVGPGTPKEKKDRPVTSRAVKGLVVDESGKPIEGALVNLTDLKTKEKWTYVTKADGRYNFDSLSLTVDYNVVAKKGPASSPVKHLSQYDHQTPAVRNLEIAHDASAKADGAPASSRPASTGKQ